MFKIARPLFLTCETPMHAGSGDDLGIVDLPIQRERHTTFPKIEASSLKGAIREAFETSLVLNNNNNPDALTKINVAFGYDPANLRGVNVEETLKPVFKDTNNKEAFDFAGCLGFTDARLLLFPVKSMKGVFAWITCEKVLKKLKTDLALCEGMEHSSLLTEIDKISNDTIQDKCYAAQNVKVGKHVVLEEYAFEIKEAAQDFQLAKELQTLLQGDSPHFPISQHLVVLSNNDFKDFVSLSTEVITRTKIDNTTGTVASGALFTEEYLPAESIMYSLILASPEYGKKKIRTFNTEEDSLKFFENIPDVIQIGGNANLGKGIVGTRFKNEGGVK